MALVRKRPEHKEDDVSRLNRFLSNVVLIFITCAIAGFDTDLLRGFLTKNLRPLRQALCSTANLEGY